MAVNGNAPAGLVPLQGAAPRYQSGKKQRDQARQNKVTNKTRTTNKTRNVTVNVNRPDSGGLQAPVVQGAGVRGGLGDIALSTSGLREYCERGRRLFREASESLGYAEEILRKALRESKPAPGESRGTAWNRANKVARSLKKAKNASAAAGGHCVRTYFVYTREFEPYLNSFGYRPPHGYNNGHSRGMDFGR